MMKKKFRCLILGCMILLIGALLLGCASNFAFPDPNIELDIPMVDQEYQVKDTNALSTATWMSKINPNVWESEKNHRGERMIALFLHTLDPNMVCETMLTDYGVDVLPYMDEAMYNENVMPRLQNELNQVLLLRQDKGLIPREEALKMISAKTMEEATAQDKLFFEEFKVEFEKMKTYEWLPTVFLLELGFALEKPVWGSVTHTFGMKLTENQLALLESQPWVSYITCDDTGTVLSDGMEILDSLSAELNKDSSDFYWIHYHNSVALTKSKEKASSLFMKEMYGYDPEIYENEEQYIAHYGASLERVISSEKKHEPDTVVQKNEYTINHYDALGWDSWHTDDTVNTLDEVCERDRKAMTALRLMVVKDECEKLMTAFCSEMDICERDLYGKDKYTATLFLWATEEEICQYAQSNLVTAVELWRPEEVLLIDSCEDSSTSRSTSTITNMVASSDRVYDADLLYQGDGIKVGVIEAATVRNGIASGIRFDENAPQIDSSKVHYVPNIQNGIVLIDAIVHDHATTVVSILAGQPVLINNAYYHGVVPDAEVFQATASNVTEFINAMNLLAELDVSVINLSWGERTTSYTEWNRQVDAFIRNTWITVVVAAGNENDNQMRSPGRSYNAITVGNAQTVSSTGYMMTSPYSVYSTSSYQESEPMANKPDVVAPGTNIGVVLSAGELTRTTGTSFAAPIVSGIVAQMYEAGNAWGYLCPEVIKSALIVTATPSKIVATDQQLCEGTAYVYDHSGAGMVSAKAAVRFMITSEQNSKIAFLQIPASKKYVCTVELEAGERIRCASVYENVMSSPDNYVNIVNLDLTLKSTDGELLATSCSPYNNIEIFEYQATTAGIYTITMEYLGSYYNSTRLLYVSTAYLIE